MTEADLMRLVQIEASKQGARLFRNNVGMGWIGESHVVTRNTCMDVQPGDVVIRRARPLHAGLCKGSSDLIGWTHDGMFCAVEVKTDTGSPTKEQLVFIREVHRAGGFSGIARSEDDLINILKG